MLGFGSIEKETAKAIIMNCYEQMSGKGINASAALREVQETHQELADQYKEMTAEEVPERYTYFWAYYRKVYEDTYLVEFTMHHINRRHALSSDGWAMLATHWILSVSKDGPRIFEETY